MLAARRAVFAGWHHPDTADTRGPYRVTFSQLAGPDVVRGEVVYAVWSEQGERIRGGRTALRLIDTSAGVWAGEIPGQPAGSTVTYHAQFTARAGRLDRHPFRQSSEYRFRVRTVVPISVSLPRGGVSSGPVEAIVRVQSGSPPSGEVVLRRLSIGSAAGTEERLALSVARPQQGETAASTYLLSANLSELEPGQIADFYFSLVSADGEESRVPEDAPARVYSIKKRLRPLQFLASGEENVLDVATIGERSWLGLKGGGLRVCNGNGEVDHWGLKDGLLSGTARFVLPDLSSGRVYVGTERGVGEIDPEGGSWLAVTSPHAFAWQKTAPGLFAPRPEGSAGPGALSTLDGTLLFQIQDDRPERPDPRGATFLELRDGRLGSWRASPLNRPLIGLSAATFDPSDGCWLLGGFVEGEGRRLEPVLVLRCGDRLKQLALQRDWGTAERRLSPQRILALTRDPSRGSVVIGLELLISNGLQSRTGYGVYSQAGSSGRLSPVAPDLAVIDAEVTALATDWRRGRILVGTYGDGVWQVQGGAARRLGAGREAAAEITSLDVTGGDGLLLVGTTRGALKLSASGDRAASICAPNAGADLTQLLPMDADLATGRVLFSSYSRGLVQLARDGAGRWRVEEALRPGRELPAGLFGDARYTPTGGVVAILHSQGFLRLEGGRARVFGPADGLLGGNLLRLLALRSGEVWVAHSPLPVTGMEGAAVQVISGDHVVRTVAIGGREAATIGSWVEVPERSSVFAATRAGVVEIRGDGSLELRSGNSASLIARDPTTGSLGVSGATLERWDWERFVPVLFRLEHPRQPIDGVRAGPPIDLAIDKTGLWWLLYRGGLVALLRPDGEFAGVMDPEDGIPPTARRILAHPSTGEIIVGSDHEGILVIGPRS